MKDFLEDSVAEKYYIISPKARQLIEKLIANGTLDSKKKFREQRIMRTIDLCVKNPREITVANCIKARYDCGISNLQADGSGVVEGVW